jgi:two-component system, cell cycle response regulator
VSILVADDDRITARVLEKQLSARGHDVQLVFAGVAAWDILRSTLPPLVAVLDWSMPGLTGPQLCQNVRARTGAPFTYLMLLTGRDQTIDVHTGLDAGADDYVKKPFDLQDVVQRVDHGLRVARDRRREATARP